MPRDILHTEKHRTALHNKELPISIYHCTEVEKLYAKMTRMKTTRRKEPRVGDIVLTLLHVISDFHYQSNPVI